MSGMTSERLAEIRERANLQCGLDGDDADDLLAHVDHLTAELATARTAWDEWKTSSRAGHSHASDMAAENARLDQAIEGAHYALTAAFPSVSPEDWQRTAAARDILHRALNPPTEGDRDE